MALLSAAVRDKPTLWCQGSPFGTKTKLCAATPRFDGDRQRRPGLGRVVAYAHKLIIFSCVLVQAAVACEVSRAASGQGPLCQLNEAIEGYRIARARY